MTKNYPVEFSISAGACIWWCLLILLTPLNLIFTFSIAAAIHEFCHLLALYLFRVPVFSISLGISGAMIQTAPLHPKQEFFCAAAGPLGSFLCILLFRIFPLIALCGFIQGIYNLLPLYPMDGGRMLHCFCLYRCPNHASMICKTAKAVTIALISGFCMFLYLRTWDRLYLLIALYFLLQTCIKRKIPCKEHRY